METHKSSFFLLLPEEIPRRPHPHFVLGKRLANRLCDWACVRILSVMVSVEMSELSSTITKRHCSTTTLKPPADAVNNTDCLVKVDALQTEYAIWI